MHVLLHILTIAVIIYYIDKVLPSVYIKNFMTAISVAIIYSLLNFFMGWFFTFLTFPLIFLTLGLFKFIINAFFLWLTDKLIRGFKIDGFGWTLLVALLITMGSSLAHRIFGY